MAKKGIQNYVNTVIFCVVLKIISIIILGLILMGYVSETIIYFLITLEIGIIVIVIAALVSISSYEKRVARETNNLLKANMSLLSCPDYYTLTPQHSCSNSYMTPDGKYIYSLNGAPTVSLSNYLNKTMKVACTAYEENVTSIGAGSNLIYKYPWTSLESKCDIL